MVSLRFLRKKVHRTDGHVPSLMVDVMLHNISLFVDKLKLILLQARDQKLPERIFETLLYPTLSVFSSQRA